MQDSLFLVPKTFCRVKIFESREVYALADDNWALIASETTPTLEAQIDAWLTETANLVQSASSPSRYEMQPAEGVKCYMSTIAICYVPAVEGADAHDKQRELKPKSKHGSTAGGTSSWAEAYGITTEKASNAATIDTGGQTPKRKGQQVGKITW